MSLSPWDNPPGLEFSLATAPWKHRQGCARRLVKEVMSFARGEAREFGWSAIDLEGYVVNKTAMIPLLQELGFEPTDERDRWRKRLS